MTINGPATRKYYSCAEARQNKAACSQSVSVPEEELRNQLAASLMRQFGTPRAVAYLRERLEASRQLGLSSATTELSALHAQHQRLETEHANLLTAIRQGRAVAAGYQYDLGADENIAWIGRWLDS